MDYAAASDAFYDSLYAKRDREFLQHIRSCAFCRDRHYVRTGKPAWKRWVDAVLAEEDVDHHLRFDVVTILMYIGWDEDRIIDYIMKRARWSDKTLKEVSYQVRHIVKKGYYMRKELKELLFKRRIYKNPFISYPSQ